VAVWRGAGSFDPARGNFRSWLLTITRNRIANEIRRRGSRPDQRTAKEDVDLSSLAGSEPSADDNAWNDFRRQTLRAAVDSLPVKQRRAVSLAFFNELTHEQVAAALDVPLGTAKTRIRSAIDSLRGQLTPLRASLLIGLFLMAGLIWEYRQSHRLEQDRRALWLVTTSDVVPVRLEAFSDVDPKTHATYRGRAGETIAVMTFWNFRPAPAVQRLRELSTLFLADKEFSGASSIRANGSITTKATSRASTIASASRRCPGVGGSAASRMPGSPERSFTNLSRRYPHSSVSDAPMTGNRRVWTWPAAARTH